MKSVRLILILAVLAAPLLPAQVRAQDERQGIGAVLDFINKLSGPRMLGPSASYFHTLGSGPRLRISVGYLTAVGSDDVIDPDGSSVQALTLAPVLEVPLGGSPVELAAGVRFHRFSGDLADPFWHWSIPGRLQGRFPLGGAASGLRLRLAAGVEYFPEFGAADFDPLVVDVKTDGGEFTFVAQVGFDWVLR